MQIKGLFGLSVDAQKFWWILVDLGDFYGYSVGMKLFRNVCENILCPDIEVGFGVARYCQVSPDIKIVQNGVGIPPHQFWLL